MDRELAQIGRIQPFAVRRALDQGGQRVRQILGRTTPGPPVDGGDSSEGANPAPDPFGRGVQFTWRTTSASGSSRRRAAGNRASAAAAG